MKPIIKKQRKTLMSAKFYKMLLSGTLSMTVVSLLLMSDSIVAGRVLDSDAVAGITLVIPLYSLAAFFASIFSLGVPIIYSRQMGEFHKKEADRTFGFGLLMSLILGILLFLLALCFGDIYLRNAAPPGEILDNARKYLFWIRFNILILPLQMLITAMVYADGDEKLSAAADLVGGVGNIIASILLSQVMGIAGISLASFLANFVSLLILLTHFIKKSNSLRFNLYFSIKLIKEVFYYSIIDAATYLFIAILTAALNAFVSARFGPKYLLMISVVTLWNEMQIIFDGVGEAVGPILGIYLGEFQRRSNLPLSPWKKSCHCGRDYRNAGIDYLSTMDSPNVKIYQSRFGSICRLGYTYSGAFLCFFKPDVLYHVLLQNNSADQTWIYGRVYQKCIAKYPFSNYSWFPVWCCRHIHRIVYRSTCFLFPALPLCYMSIRKRRKTAFIIIPFFSV